MIPDSAGRDLDLIQAIDRDAFGVHLDAVNVINSPYAYYDTTAVIQECFEKLGEHVVSCHLKDIWMEDDISLRLTEVLAGQGGFDIRSYVSGVAGLAHQPPLMLEHLKSPADYDRAREYVLSVARDIGVSLDP